MFEFVVGCLIGGAVVWFAKEKVAAVIAKIKAAVIC